MTVATMQFVRAAQQMLNAHYDRFFEEARSRTGDPKFGARVLKAERGRRYIRIVVADLNGTGRSAWAFVDTQSGDILKPASWKTPAKHARGNVFDPNPLRYVGVHGPAYLR